MSASSTVLGEVDAYLLARRSWAPLKRALDVLLAGTLLLLFVPFGLAIATAILLDSPGPVLFSQTRVGRYGKTFRMVKFRSMRPDRRKRNIGPPTGVIERRRVHKSLHDPRITRVGRILRRTCLDEVPQLVNVLRGEMSLVGPRPELPEIVARYQPWQHARHAVLPGITGWWQVNRDGTRLMHESTEMDLYYLAHASLALDVVILLRTVRMVLRGVGAF
jgi:lipopolysaccharide/colanic/teichoic acid biosynthesis glycosyltransferase